MSKKAKENSGEDYSYTQNREISWLKFNERVLEEAADESAALFERLKFAAIFSSNLDEFYMIRVGSLLDLSLIKEAGSDNKSGLTPQEQLDEIFRLCRPLYRHKDDIFEDVMGQLKEHDIFSPDFGMLTEKESKFAENYFKDYIRPVLSPQVVDTHHPFPHLENEALYIIVKLMHKGSGLFGIVPVPKNLPRILYLPGVSVRFLLVEDIIKEYTDSLFDMYSVDGKALVRVTRNADINLESVSSDEDEDYRHYMKSILKKRDRLAPVRLEIQGKADKQAEQYLCPHLNLKKDQVFVSRSPVDMSYVYQLKDKIPASVRRHLLYPEFEPRKSDMVSVAEPIHKQAARRDILLFYPYESMEPVLAFVREAAFDPSVISIKITLYRIDRQSRLAENLIAAAENGKDVTVLMELRARFDEQNNIEWAERLEQSGCRVIYGFEGIKVHSKICLVTRRDKNRFSYTLQIGTGNYNEVTARLYSDLSLITADQRLVQDAIDFFRNMSIGNLEGSYSHLLVAPNGLKQKFIDLIDREIQKARNRQGGRIIIKINSLTDRDVIDKLSQASRAGVRISLIIRGICCIVPGLVGKTENIEVRSIVGRFLEHTRVFCFGEGDEAEVLIGSADLMTRNTQRRVEIACPIYDKEIKRRIIKILQQQQKDNIKARELTPNGNYVKCGRQLGQNFNVQEYFMQQADEKAKAAQQDGAQGFWSRLTAHLSGRR